MNKVIRTTLAIAGAALLLSAVTVAQAGTNDSKDKGKQGQAHHSRLARAAFWKHKKKDDAGSAKKAQPAHATPQTTQHKTKAAKTEPGKPAVSKTQKQTKQLASSKPAEVKKAPARKTSATAKSKPKQKKPQMQTVSVKQ